MSRSEPLVVHEADCALEGSDEAALDAVRWRTRISGDRTPSAYTILPGEGAATISGIEHAVRPGSAVFIPGGAAHGAVNTAAELLRLLCVLPSNSFSDVEYEFKAP